MEYLKIHFSKVYARRTDRLMKVVVLVNEDWGRWGSEELGLVGGEYPRQQCGPYTPA